MADSKNHRDDDTLFEALEQLGKALGMMQSVFSRIEAHVAESREADAANDDPLCLTADIPDSYTLH